MVVFLEDLPKGIPPKHMGHEFKIDLELGTNPIFRPIFKLGPLELQEVKLKLTECLSMD